MNVMNVESPSVREDKSQFTSENPQERNLIFVMNVGSLFARKQPHFPCTSENTYRAEILNALSAGKAFSGSHISFIIKELIQERNHASA